MAELINAVKNNNLQEVIRLLDAGADPNMMGEYRHTLLQLAVIYSNKDIINTLIEHGANINVKPGINILSSVLYRRDDPLSMFNYLLQLPDIEVTQDAIFWIYFRFRPNPELQKQLLKSAIQHMQAKGVPEESMIKMGVMPKNILELGTDSIGPIAPTSGGRRRHRKTKAAKRSKKQASYRHKTRVAKRAGRR
jgi:hypothetical protein